eukprot:CAMPEP_0202705924 /NCGR_PEP_ID=MMETSP1385-20130828/18427_1 /ASSEMBLY_ACC=CAM_ASM_000861 /TAXON_ID=933848 /ORGANISM="Elphidium margaritaceum" /LENGTH=59 /DNA_ID=CAMNT_0049364281 /DNA_START=712 /DNA_END=888 /DNA_ORIENTATION=-
MFDFLRVHVLDEEGAEFEDLALAVEIALTVGEGERLSGGVVVDWTEHDAVVLVGCGDDE